MVAQGDRMLAAPSQSLVGAVREFMCGMYLQSTHHAACKWPCECLSILLTSEKYLRLRLYSIHGCVHVSA